MIKSGTPVTFVTENAMLEARPVACVTKKRWVQGTVLEQDTWSYDYPLEHWFLCTFNIRNWWHLLLSYCDDVLAVNHTHSVTSWMYYNLFLHIYVLGIVLNVASLAPVGHSHLPS